MRLDDPHDELAALVAEAADAGPRTADRTAEFLAGVLDAAQAHRPWAEDELAAIQQAGATARFKRHWKPEPKPVPVGSIEVMVQTVVGIERNGEWQQLPMGDLTVGEFQSIVRQRKSERDRLSNNLVALRRVQAFVAEHGPALGAFATVADVLAARNVTLLDVMAGAA